MSLFPIRRIRRETTPGRTFLRSSKASKTASGSIRASAISVRWRSNDGGVTLNSVSKKPGVAHSDPIIILGMRRFLQSTLQFIMGGAVSLSMVGAEIGKAGALPSVHEILEEAL